MWGLTCKELSADWAAQRIKGLSLKTAIWNALFPHNVSGDQGGTIKTLLRSFRYPRKGPGMMWEACAEKVRGMGGIIEMDRRVVGCSYDAGAEVWTITHVDRQYNARLTNARRLISSASPRARPWTPA